MEHVDLGAQTYSKAELLDLLAMSPGGDASLILAHQLIAAKLNSSQSAVPSSIVEAMALADTLLAAIGGRLPLHVDSSVYTGQGMIWVAAKLAAFNESCKEPLSTTEPLTRRPPVQSLPGTGAGGRVRGRVGLTGLAIGLPLIMLVALEWWRRSRSRSST